MIRSPILVAVCVLAYSIGCANASLIGDEISGCVVGQFGDCEIDNGFSAQLATVVDPGVEFTLGVTRYADFSSDSFVLNLTNNHTSLDAHYNAFIWTFEGLDWVDVPNREIQNVELLSGNTLLVFSISFEPHSISIVTSNVVIPSGEFVSAEFNIATIQTVPIPPALFLFGSGLLGLIGISRRKKSI